MLYDNPATVNQKRLVNCFGLTSSDTTNITLHCSVLLVRKLSHSSRVGSYNVIILAFKFSAFDTCMCRGRLALVHPSSRQEGPYLSKGYSSMSSAEPSACRISSSLKNAPLMTNMCSPAPAIASHSDPQPTTLCCRRLLDQMWIASPHRHTADYRSVAPRPTHELIIACCFFLNRVLSFLPRDATV